MRKRETAISLLLLLSLSGCGWIRQNRVADYAAVGRIENNIYTSPRQSFRIRLPFVSSGSRLRDERPTPNRINVTIEDNLCRQFTVSEEPGSLGMDALQSWVDRHIVEDLKRRGLNVESKALTTRNGPASALLYRAPAAAPCRRTTETAGKRIETKLDADVGWHVYHRDGVFYRLIYTVGIGPGAPSLWYINREPADEVLAQFAEGFEILEVKERPGLPE